MENRCSFPSEAATNCGVRLLTMWRVKAGPDYHTVARQSRIDSRNLISQAGSNVVAVRTDGGSGVLIARGREHRLEKNSLLLFDFPGLDEYRTAGKHWNFWWVEFSSTEPMHLPMHKVMIIPRLSRERERCEEMFRKLGSAHMAQRHLAAALWQTLFYEWRVLSGVLESRPAHPHETALRKMLEAIQREPHLAWTLDDMAVSAGLSDSVLRRCCAESLGMTPSQVRVRIKLAHAQAHLRRGDRSVAEVAELLGFCDPFHFSKAYKLRYGHSPKMARTVQMNT